MINYEHLKNEIENLDEDDQKTIYYIILAVEEKQIVSEGLPQFDLKELKIETLEVIIKRIEFLKERKAFVLDVIPESEDKKRTRSERQQCRLLKKMKKYEKCPQAQPMDEEEQEADKYIGFKTKNFGKLTEEQIKYKAVWDPDCYKDYMRFLKKRDYILPQHKNIVANFKRRSRPQKRPREVETIDERRELIEEIGLIVYGKEGFGLKILPKRRIRGRNFNHSESKVIFKEDDETLEEGIEDSKEDNTLEDGIEEDETLEVGIDKDNIIDEGNIDFGSEDDDDEDEKNVIGDDDEIYREMHAFF